jgi:hypothetical protein
VGMDARRAGSSSREATRPAGSGKPARRWPRPCFPHSEAPCRRAAREKPVEGRERHGTAGMAYSASVC